MVTRFFVPDRFAAKDLEWVCRRRAIPWEEVQFGDYQHNRSLYRHRTMILNSLGYEAFEEVHRLALAPGSRATDSFTNPSGPDAGCIGGLVAETAH